MFNVNFNDVISKITPVVLRKEKNLGLLNSIIKPLQTLNVGFVLFRNRIQYKLQFNAQIIYLEHYLNDQYDPANRAIYIEDTANVDFQYVFNKIEEVPGVFFFNNSEQFQPIYYLGNSDEYTNQVDYIVMIPQGIDYNELLVRKQILTYNQAGRRFNINTF